MKKSSLLLSSIAVVAYTIFWLLTHRESHNNPNYEGFEVSETQNESLKKDSADKIFKEKRSISESTTKNSIESKGIWRPDLAPLKSEELARVGFLQDQIDSFNKLGYIPEENINEFRNYMWKYADRAVAHAARKLNSISRDSVTNKDQAKELIKDIDMLGYLSDATHVLSKEVIRLLATRPIHWDEYGNLKDSVSANVTFEAFDLLAKNYPELARSHMEKIPKEKLQGYILRYIYGRNLKGLEEEDIKSEISYIIASAKN